MIKWNVTLVNPTFAVFNQVPAQSFVRKKVLEPEMKAKQEVTSAVACQQEVTAAVTTQQEMEEEVIVNDIDPELN